MEPIARRLCQRLLEPIHLVTYFSDEPTEAFQALGYEGYWMGYFAGRSAPLGRVPAEVVDALFYNFAPGEVARFIPSVWSVATPEAVLAARQQGSVKALRRILGDLADTPRLARAADLATRAATSAPMEGRILYSALRSLPVPGEPVARLWHAATLLREHRGDGHLAALVSAGIGGQEAHVLHALSLGMKPEEYGRLDPLTPAQLAAVVDGLRARGLVDATAAFTAAGRETKDRIESMTDALAAPAYESLQPGEVDQLIADLEPLVATIDSVGY
jgi:Helix-turn-helix family